MSLRQSLMATAALTALSVAPAAYAQQITSAIIGTVTNPDGTPAAGAQVTVSNPATGTRRTVTAGPGGGFSARNLSVGGPYSVQVTAPGAAPRTITDIFIDTSGSANLSIALTTSTSDVEEITVTASAQNFSFTALGPSSAFSKDKIRELPSISRNITDIIRIDPRVVINEGGGIECLGQNPNFNAFTIDGVRASDPFGLNGTGNLARNTFPIPFDSVGSTSVEFAPIDVQYGQFSGCQVNVTTQRGTNDFHGSAFFIYSNEDLTGDEIEGDPVFIDDFDQFQWGADLGGPIIEDKLFFYFSYEEFDQASIQEDGPAFLDFTDPLDDFITEDLVNEFADILVDSFGRDPALQNIVSTNPVSNRRFFGRLDWNITDQHRLEFTYARLEEIEQAGDGIGGGGGAVFTFQDSFQNVGTNSDTFSARLFSDWTENFSTEIRISRQLVEDIQNPVGGGEAQLENIPRIAVADPTFPFLSLNPFFGQGLTSGPGIFRSANQLDTELDQIKVAGFYDIGDHTLTFGYELDSLEVFNLFITNATGTIFFEDLEGLAAGEAIGFDAAGSFSGDPFDAAAAFTRDIHSIYFQDTWQVTEDFQVIAGIRYDFYDAGVDPTFNPLFTERFGFDNTTGFNNLDIWLPRIGINWTLPEETFGQTTLRAGFGVFSVAGPTVWISNAFSNFGGAIGEIESAEAAAACAPEDFQVLDAGGNFTGIPSCVTAAQQIEASTFDGRVDAVDPDFDLPSEARANIGFTHFSQSSIGFFDSWEVNFDFIFSQTQSGVDFVDLTLSPTGELTPDGRPIVTAVDPLLPGCDAVFQAPRVGFASFSPECDAGGDDQDILLTNVDGDSGRSVSTTISVSKLFQLGDVTTLDFTAAYNYSDVTRVNTGQNSTATTGFENTVSLFPNSVPLAPAVFQVQHAITVQWTLSHDFFDGLSTRLGVFYRGGEGTPFSFVFDDATGAGIFGDSDAEDRILPYIPTGIDDPLVDFSGLTSDEVTALFAFYEETGLDEFAGSIAPRNVFTNPWVNDLDFRLTQDLPGFFGSDGFQIFIDFQNVLNLIDSSLGAFETIDEGDVPEGSPFIGVSEINEEGQFVFTDFDPQGFEFDPNLTLWQISLGIRYQF